MVPEIGFLPDHDLLAACGVRFDDDGVPEHDPQTMETNVPGLFVAGTAAGGTQSKFVHFISTTHTHVGKIVRAITGEVPQQLGTIPARNNAVSWEEVKAN